MEGGYFKEFRAQMRVLHPQANWEKSMSTLVKAFRNRQKLSNGKVYVIKSCEPMYPCEECRDYSNRISMCEDKEQLLAIREARERHYSEVREERAQYLKHKTLARTQSDQYLSLIIDGMDQKKKNIPNADGSRNTGGKNELLSRVIGVLVHGHRAYAYICPDNVPHNINTIWTILFKVMADIGLKKLSRLKKVFIQMDNTCSDNKTKVCFAIATILVTLGLLPNIVFTFLPVGHTHADIDQMFGVLARYLSRHIAHTFEQIEKAFRLAFTKWNGSVLPLSTEILKRGDVLDFRSWLGQGASFPKLFMEDVMGGMMDQHGFSLDVNHVDREGYVQVGYKEWARQEDYIYHYVGLRPKPQQALMYLGYMPLGLTPKKLREVAKGFKSANDLVQRAKDQGKELDGGLKTAALVRRGEAYDKWMEYARKEANRGYRRCAKCKQLNDKLNSLKPNKKLSKDLNKANDGPWKKAHLTLMDHLHGTDCSDELKVKPIDGTLLKEDFLNFRGEPAINLQQISGQRLEELGHGFQLGPGVPARPPGGLQRREIAPGDVLLPDFGDGPSSPTVEAERTQAITAAGVQTLQAQALKDGVDIKTYTIPHPERGKFFFEKTVENIFDKDNHNDILKLGWPTMGPDRTRKPEEMKTRGDVLKLNHRILFFVESKGPEPVFVGIVKRLTKFRGFHFLTLQWCGDGNGGFCNKYLPLKLVSDGKEVPYLDVYPLDIPDFSLQLIHWGFKLRKTPVNTLTVQTLKVLRRDVRDFLTPFQYNVVYKLSGTPKRKAPRKPPSRNKRKKRKKRNQQDE